MKNKLRNMRGITLIALVITIIVLLILAGVTIATLTGENGILAQAQKAKESTEVAKFRDAVQLAYMTAYSENAKNGTYTVGMAEIIGKLLIDHPEYDGIVTIQTEDVVASIIAKSGGNLLNNTDSPVVLAKQEQITITIVPITMAGIGGIAYVELNGKDYEIIIRENDIILEETMGDIPAVTDETRIQIDPSLEGVTAIPENNLSITIKAGSSTVEGDITISYGGKNTTVKVQVKELYTVTVQAEKDESNNEQGTATITPSSTDNKYEKGSILNLQATANSGYYFDGWYDGATKLEDANPYSYTVGTSDITITAKFYQKYGRSTNIGTITVGETNLTKGWKFFYEDEATNGNIYLIYGDYLESDVIPTTGTISKNKFSVWSTSSRDDLLAYLKGTGSYTSTWSSLNNAIKLKIKSKILANGTTEANANTAVSKIVTKGALTPEQWINSYNENYGTKLGAQNFNEGQTYYYSGNATSAGTATSTTRFKGYLYTRDNTESPIKWEGHLMANYMTKLAGYPTGSSNMYYPHKSWYNGSEGYWLARR